MNQNKIVVGVHIKCEPEEFKKVLSQFKLNYSNDQIKIMKYYYDPITYFFFETTESRQVIMEIFKNDAFKEIVAEVGFYDSIEDQK